MMYVRLGIRRYARESQQILDVTLKIDIFIAVRMAMVVFWVAMHCGLLGRYQRLGGTY
jgi:hypothetical protein